MLDIDFTLNLVTISIIIVIAGIVGYASRSQQIRKNQMKIIKLRREMANNHAHILELQKECVNLEKLLHTTKVTVLPLKSIVQDFKEEDQDRNKSFNAAASLKNKRKVNHTLSWKQRI